MNKSRDKDKRWDVQDQHEVFGLLVFVARSSYYSHVWRQLVDDGGR